MDDNEDLNNDEPPHFKFGVYYDDGYDYMKHLMTREDFDDPARAFKPKFSDHIVYKKHKTMKPKLVIKEVECTNEKEVQDKIKKAIFDEDIVKGLEGEEVNNDDEDIDDYFKTLIGSDEENDDEDQNISENDESEQNYNVAELKSIIKEFEDKNEDNFLEIDDDIIDEIKLTVPESMKEFCEEFLKSKKDKDIPLSYEELKIFADQMQYEDEEEVRRSDEMIEKWFHQRKKKFDKNLIFNKPTEISKIRSELIVIPPLKRKTKRNCSSRISESLASDDDNANEVVNINIVRNKNESAEEKRQRKKDFKSAKKARVQENKLRRELQTKY